MKLLEKKDVFEQKRLQEQQMVINGSQISDLVQKHQKKLDEAKQDFVSEVEKQKQVFDEMVSSYLSRISLLKSEVADLSFKRQQALEPLLEEEERLKTIERSIVEKETAIASKSVFLDNKEQDILTREKAFRRKELDTRENHEISILNLLNSQKKLSEAETIKSNAILESKRSEILVKSAETELEVQKKQIETESISIQQERQDVLAIQKFQKEQEKALNEKQRLINDTYLTLSKAIQEYNKEL